MKRSELNERKLGLRLLVIGCVNGSTSRTLALVLCESFQIRERLLLDANLTLTSNGTFCYGRTNSRGIAIAIAIRATHMTPYMSL